MKCLYFCDSNMFATTFLCAYCYGENKLMQLTYFQIYNRTFHHKQLVAREFHKEQSLDSYEYQALFG